MTDVRVVVFAEQTAIGAEDVVAFWVREGALREQAARERVEQVLMIALDGEDVVGVATAYLERNERLLMTMWYFRLFVAVRHRRTSLARRFGHAGRDLLRERFAAGDHRASGIVYEVHNRWLAEADPRDWEALGFTFIGETAAGAHVRVHYFPGVPAPAPSS